MADEREAVAGDDPSPPPGPAVAALLLNASVVRRLGGLDGTVLLLYNVCKPIHHVVGALGVDWIEHAPAPDRHQKEDTPEDRAQVCDPVTEGWKLFDRPLADGGIYLER